MRSHIAKIGLISAAGFLVAGCATSVRSKGQEADTLTQQVASLQGRVGALSQQMEEITRRQVTMESATEGWQATQEPAAHAKAGSISIRRIQLALKTTGFYDGAIDGKAGNQTREAVKAFQRSRGLTPDGKVGAKTAAALAKAIPSSSAGESESFSPAE